MSTQFEPGAPVPSGFIPLCVPHLAGNEWAYVKECLDTNWVSSVGPFVDRFEQALAAYVGVPYAVATVNGTAALHIALLASGVQADDEVVIPTLTFIAPANAVRYVGAWPVFVDAEPDYWQMDPHKVSDFLERGCQWRAGALYNKTTGRRVRAILPVHVLGHPVDMDPIVALARKYDLTVIEDATESLGTKYKGHKLGGLGDFACFSFNGNKIITTGGGGMLVTNNEALAKRARYLSTQAKDDPLEYIHGEIGYNYRLTNLQAALGVAQMERLDEYIAAKRHIAAVYTQALQDMPGITPLREAEWAYSIFWMYTILVDEARCGLGSRALLDTLRQAGIQSRPLWQPLHQSPVFAALNSRPLAVAERLNRQALSLPCSVGISEHEMHSVVGAIKSAVHHAGRA